jgi:large subunit ribosomal protein L23
VELMLETPWDVVIRPLITEKSVSGSRDRKYTFRVHSKANKIQIRSAVERIYSVKVSKVNTANIKGKPRRRGGRVRPGRTSNWKKAVVTLEAGFTIDIFESAE